MTALRHLSHGELTTPRVCESLRFLIELLGVEQEALARWVEAPERSGLREGRADPPALNRAGMGVGSGRPGAQAVSSGALRKRVRMQKKTEPQRDRLRSVLEVPEHVRA